MPPRCPPPQCGGTESHLVKLFARGELQPKYYAVCLLLSLATLNFPHVFIHSGCLEWQPALSPSKMEAPGELDSTTFLSLPSVWFMADALCIYVKWIIKTNRWLETVEKWPVLVHTPEKKIKSSLPIKLLLNCHQLINFNLRWPGCKVSHLIIQFYIPRKGTVENFLIGLESYLWKLLFIYCNGWCEEFWKIGG